MRIEKSIRKAFDEFDAGDAESAMLHVCNAVDGTAAKVYPNMGSNRRFSTFLRDNYHILGPMGCPGIDVVNQRFAVRVERPNAPGGKPDLADLIYGIHRCSHGHGQALPDGFELLDDVAGPAGNTRMVFDGPGAVQLSDRLIFGLLATVIMSPVNIDLRIPDGYFLSFGQRSVIMLVNDWWGRSTDFCAIAESEPMPLVNVDWGGGP
jgi:hypothetical protein